MLSTPEYVVSSVAAMAEHANAFARTALGGEIIGLVGELGAGKTEFARAFVQTFAPGMEVTSPSFTIENIYDVRNQTFSAINHLDLYRLPVNSTFPQLDDYLCNGDCLTLVEWPDRIRNAEDLLSWKVWIASFGKPGATTRCVRYELINPQHGVNDGVISAASGSRSGEERIRGLQEQIGRQVR